MPRRALSTLSAPRNCHVHEVTPRDGIQNEAAVLSLDQRIELVRLIATRMKPSSVEVASFVRGDLVPAMAGSVELCRAIEAAPWARRARRAGMDFAALVPNARGYEMFRDATSAPQRLSRDEDDECGDEGLPLQVIDVVVAITSCTDSHSRANVLQPMQTALRQTGELVRAATGDGRRVQAYATMAFGCPFEGAVSCSNVARVVEEYVKQGAHKIILADTLGVAEPRQIRELVDVALVAGATLSQLGLHLHDAHGRAHENIQAGLDVGVRHFDSATSGCGGCNFVPDARGNVSTQTLQRVLNANELPSPIDMEGLTAVHHFLSEALDRELIDF